MSHEFLLLVDSASAWVLLHIGLSGSPLRERILKRIGEKVYRALFSLASILVLAWMALSYVAAGPVRILWSAPPWLGKSMMLLMLPAIFLLVCASTGPNPTMRQRGLSATDPTVGIVRITRHPQFWFLSLWGIVHVVVVGTASAAVFGGAIVLTALAGMPSLDGKCAQVHPKLWPRFEAATSILPFAAIAGGRNRLVLSEFGWWRPLLALAAWAGLIAMHPWLFHANPGRFFH